MKIIYRVSKRTINGKETYGIETVRQFNDIFKTQKEANEFIGICEKLNLSDIHIEEVLDDYLNK